MSRKSPKPPPDPLAPTEPAMPAVRGPSSSGEHEAVRRLHEELGRAEELAESIKRGEIPSSPIPPGPDSPPVTLRPEHLDAATARQERILVVEDDGDIRATLADVLRDEGYAVREAVDGVDGLEKITEPIPPDLVILDLGLPRLSGKAVAAAMDADDIAIPRLIISAGGNVRRLLEKHPELEGEFVFPKPLDLEAFLRKVSQRIAEYRARPKLPWR